MIGKDLGFDKDNVVYVYDRGGFVKNYQAFRNEMRNEPGIVDVTLKDIDPAGWCRGNTVRNPGDEQDYLMEFCQIEPNYFDMMGMKMVMGREFAEETGDSLHYCILNETAARVLGFPNLSAKEFIRMGNTISCVESLRMHRPSRCIRG